MQGQRGEAGDHRVGALRGDGPGPAGVEQCGVQPVLAGGRPRPEQEHAGQELLPGTRPAARGDLAGGNAAGPQLVGGREAFRDVGGGGEGEGEGVMGVLWFMPGVFRSRRLP